MKHKAFLALTGLSAALLPTATAKAEGLPGDIPQTEPEPPTAEQQTTLLQAIQAVQPEPVKFIAPVDVYATVKPEILAVMSGPGESYGISLTLTKNQGIHITGATADFYRIDMGLAEGYVRQDMVTIGTVPQEIEIPSTDVSVTPTNFVATANTNVNYRTGPGTGHEVAGVLPKGSTVSITGVTKNGWYVIPGPDGDWYVNSKYLDAGQITEEGTVSTAEIPVKEAPETEPEHKDQTEEERLNNLLKLNDLNKASKQQAEKAAVSAEQMATMTPEELRLSKLLDGIGTQNQQTASVMDSLLENASEEVRPYLEAAKESYAQAEALTEKARLEELLAQMEQDKASNDETKIQEELKKQEEAAKNPAILEIIPTEQGTKDRADYEAAKPDYHYDWEQVAPPETYDGENPGIDLSYRFPVPDDYYNYYTVPETPVIPAVPEAVPEQVTDDTEKPTGNEALDFLNQLERMQQEQSLKALAEEDEDAENGIVEDIAGEQADGNVNVAALEAARVSTSEVELLAKLIMHEAGGEGTEGRKGVAEVVINRMESSRFPDTLEGVIFQKHQFQDAHKVRGHKADAEALSIAREYLAKHYAGSTAGDMFPSSVLYFRNAVTCGASPYTNWGKLPFYKKINHHTFYSQA